MCVVLFVWCAHDSFGKISIVTWEYPSKQRYLFLYLDRYNVHIYIYIERKSRHNKLA